MSNPRPRPFESHELNLPEGQLDVSQVLENIDSLFSESESARALEDASPADDVEAALSAQPLWRFVARVESVANSTPNKDLREACLLFLSGLRGSMARLAAQFDEVADVNPAAGEPLEIQVSFEQLHDFMLSPESCRLGTNGVSA